MYYSKIDKKTINNELLSIDKPLLYENRGIPYYSLEAREFEIFTYHLFEEEFVKSQKKYDSIDLMSGVAEKGRDAVLYMNQNITGIIQCKHSINKTKMSKPECAKEILKFILNVIKYNIVSDKENIKYYFVHSEGFKEPAQKLLNMFNTEIICDKPQLKKWIKEITSNYKKLADLKYSVIEKDLLIILKTIRIQKFEKTDIDKMLHKYPKIMTMFFTVKNVILDELELPTTYEDKAMPDNEIVTYYSKRFVEQLKVIKSNKADTIKAINDYWRMNNTFNLLIEKEFVSPELLSKYESDLNDMFDFEYSNACERINNESYINSESRIFYRNIMKMNPIKIMNLKNNRPFFQRGYYHDLINSSTIDSWKLQPYEEGDEDE